MSEGKRRIVVETDNHVERFEATSFDVGNGHLFVYDGAPAVAVFAPGAWLNAFDEDTRAQRVEPAA